MQHNPRQKEILLLVQRRGFVSNEDLAQAFSVTPQTIRMSSHHMYFDPSKAVRELGFPQTSARDALAKAVDWFKENGYCSPMAIEQ